MSLDKKVIGKKMRTISEPICKVELVKNITIEICYKVTNTNSNSIYILINICLDGYTRNELCAYIGSSYSIYFGKRTLFSEFMWKKTKNPL